MGLYDVKQEDILLHDLLDQPNLDSEASKVRDADRQRLLLYRDVLQRLEHYQEAAPGDLASRVMSGLPDRPPIRWTDRLRAIWPERRFRAVTGFAGALALLLVVAGVTFLWSRREPVLIPVVLDLYAPSARQVELVGTFSDWTRRGLRLKGPDAVGYWNIGLRLPPGRYEYTFLIDGLNRVPDDDGEGLRPDGLGYENSVIILNTGNGTFHPQPSVLSSDAYVTLSEDDSNLTTLPVQDRRQWQAILGRGIAAGLQGEELEAALLGLAAADVKPTEVQTILGPLFQDVQAGIYARHLLLKLQEAAFKRAPRETLHSIARARYDAFKGARKLLANTGHMASIQTEPALMCATAFALESGQDPSLLQEALRAGKGKPPGRVAAVIEAGEILHHAGLEPESLAPIMRGCLEKDLEKQEIKRLTQRIRRELQKGTDPKIIQHELWHRQACMRSSFTS